MLRNFPCEKWRGGLRRTLCGSSSKGPRCNGPATMPAAPLQSSPCSSPYVLSCLVQALTKYVVGHSDCVLGAIVVRTEEDWRVRTQLLFVVGGWGGSGVRICGDDRFSQHAEILFFPVVVPHDRRQNFPLCRTKPCVMLTNDIGCVLVCRWSGI
jgi:hypothetical protein